MPPEANFSSDQKNFAGVEGQTSPPTGATAETGWGGASVEQGDAMGRCLHTRWVNLKRAHNGLEPAGPGVLDSLWHKQGEDARVAWNALWVGLVRRGYDGGGFDA